MIRVAPEAPKPKYQRVKIRVRESAPSQTLTQMVKSIVKKQAEVKNVGKVLDNYGLHNNSITTGDWTFPLPPITQGTGETQRIGDRVMPKALVVKVHVAFNSQVGGIKSIMGRLHVVKHKKFTSQAELSTNLPVDGLKLLVDGDGSPAAYDGTIENTQYSLNTDLWTKVATRNFTMGKDNTASQTGYPFREFTIRIPCPAKLVYTDASQTLPENFCPAMAFGWTWADGTAPDPANQQVMVFAQSFFTYTDE